MMEKEEFYEKIVEYKPYKWQEEDVGWSSLVFFLSGVFVTILDFGIFYDNGIMCAFGYIPLLILILICSIQKRKVKYRKIKQ